MPISLTKTQETEIQRIRAYFPYRIVYAMIDKKTGKFFASAVTSMRIPNQMAREGHTVFIVKGPAPKKKR